MIKIYCGCQAPYYKFTENMLSYRHAFHAGNHADVLKHTILIACIHYLKKKDKPFAYYDTHAGPGLYELNTRFAAQNKEFETGITRLWNLPNPPDAINDYMSTIREQNTHSLLSRYPGSPLIAAQLLRSQDRLVLSELHPADFDLLKKNLNNYPHSTVWKADGFERALKELPPRERRGLILIDPPYEMKEDYERVIDFLKSAHRKFPQGLYLLWYPIVERERITKLITQLKKSGISNIQKYELCITQDTTSRGMTGSGMITINPPWTLQKVITPALKTLCSTLSEKDLGNYTFEQLTPE